MIKANVRPYPVVDDMSYRIVAVKFGEMPLGTVEASKGYVVDCSSLKGRTSGELVVELQIETTPEQVCTRVFQPSLQPEVHGGIRALCKESKFRQLFPADSSGLVSARIPLKNLRGVTQLDVLYLTKNAAVSVNGLHLSEGTVVGTSLNPILLPLDEDWTGETIRVDWLDFGANGLPQEALIHVELSGGSQTPKVWLNASYQNQIESVLLRTGDGSPIAIAGAALRVLIWQHVWEKVVPWAVIEESPEDDSWPASRISKMWREKFREHGWELPNGDHFDAECLNELSVRIQHCVRAAQNLARVHGLLNFQPEFRGAQ